MAKKYENLFSKGSLIKDKGLLQHQQIKTQIKVLPELEALIPPLQEEEFAQLSANIRKEGCREALLVWKDQEEYILVDGHNRFRICNQYQLDFKINLMMFADLEEVRNWMIDNQLGRRNLNPNQTSYLRGMRYNLEKKEKGGYDKIKSKGQNDLLTAERLAKEYNVSEKTIKRDAQFAAGVEKLGKVNPKFKEEILGGMAKINKSDIQKVAQVEALENIQSLEEVSTIVTPSSKTTKTTQAEQGQALIQHKKHIQSLIEKLALGKADNEAVYQELLTAVKHIKTLI